MCMCTKKMIVKVKKGIKTIIKIVKNTCFYQQKIKKKTLISIADLPMTRCGQKQNYNTNFVKQFHEKFHNNNPQHNSKIQNAQFGQIYTSQLQNPSFKTQQNSTSCISNFSGIFCDQGNFRSRSPSSHFKQVFFHHKCEFCILIQNKMR